MHDILERLTERQRMDLLALYDARRSTIYGGLFDAFSAKDYKTLRAAGLIRSYIPVGCMAPLTKLSPKGYRLIESAIRAFASADTHPKGQDRETELGS